MKRTMILGILIMSLIFIPLSTSAYTIDDLVGDKIGVIGFELYGINAIQSGSILSLDIFTNYPEAGITVSSWATKAGDLAIDANGDGFYEYGVAFRNHDGFTKGSLYAVTDWYISDDYAPSTSYIYNHNIEVSMKAGTLLSAGLVTWSDIAGTEPDYSIGTSIDLSFLSGITDGTINILYGAWFKTIPKVVLIRNGNVWIAARFSIVMFVPLPVIVWAASPPI